MPATITALDMERESLERHNRIDAHIKTIGADLLWIKENEGWKYLKADGSPFASWSDYLTRGFKYSRKHLYEIMRGAPVQEILNQHGISISLTAALALTRYSQELWVLTAQIIIARYGEITKSNVDRVGSVLAQAALTGYVNTGDGENSTGLEAALTLEDLEAHERQKAHIANKVSRNYLIEPTTAVIVDTKDHFLSLQLNQNVQALGEGMVINVAIWTQADT